MQVNNTSINYWVVGGKNNMVWILINIINWFVITIIVDAYLMTLPKLEWKMKKSVPEVYQIINNNRIDIQDNYECAAFSSAYVFRHFGIDADGIKLYEDFPNKMRTGYVYPKGIINNTRNYGFQISYRKGNIETLKYHISKGVPVIVFIKVFNNKNYTHYVPVTGYDKEYFYLAESLNFLVNCEDNNGLFNRKIAVKEFKKLWNTKAIKMPIYSNTYFVLSTNY